MFGLRNIERLLLYINILIINYITFVIFITQYNIVNSNMSTVFINTVDSIAYNSKILLIAVLICSALLLVLEHINTVQKLKIMLVELAIILFIVYALGFNYNGLIMLFFVKCLSINHNAKIKYSLLAVAIIFYVITDQNLLMSNFRTFIFMDYINFYTSFNLKILIIFFTILKSSNTVLFIIYCGTYIQQQQDMNKQLIRYADEREKYGQINERNRVAREIHDSLGHVLTGISYGLEAAIVTVDTSSKKTKEQLHDLLDISKGGIAEVRTSVYELRKGTVLDKDIIIQLEGLISKSQKASDINIHYEINLYSNPYKKNIESTIYRVIQEGITNALRHSEAENLKIELAEKNSKIHIKIKDDGVGCDNIDSGFGIVNIRERIMMLNGAVEFKSNNGFEISAWFPIV